MRRARPDPNADLDADLEAGPARRAVRLTRAGMVWEAAAAAFWPLGVILAAVLCALAFGGTDLLPGRGLIVALVTALLGLALALLWGLRRFRRPSLQAARARVDASLPGHPLSALRDEMAVGAGDAGADALWQAHQHRMAQAARAARPIRADARLRWRDPVALRLAGLVAVVMALLFAPAGRFGQGIAALGATLRPAPELRPDVGAAPAWEGWAEPPAYTRRPTIYLNALPEGQVLELPQGSKLSFRLYGSGAALQQDLGAVVTGDPAAPELVALHSGTVEIGDRRLAVTVIPDAAPEVRPVVQPDRRADGRFVQPFSASDDNGVVSGKAVITLDLAAVDRRYGLAVAAEPRDPVVIELPMPATGSRKQVQGQLVADLSRHPWANLPVTVALQVQDGIDQQGRSAPVSMVLPGRRFFDPTAAALVEIRRDLLWSRQNAGRSAELLRAISWQPQDFLDPALAEGLRGAIGTLEGGPLSEDARNALAQLLWDAAVALEDGGLADALERMNQAQERLSEAIRNGASPDEVQRLMDELRKATDAYTDMLAQKGQDPAQKFDRSNQQGQRITGDQIQKMMDEIQRLMNEGRMAEAQELLDQFNRMMQNMRVTQSQDGEGGRQRPGDRLAETLRQQQRLADEAMRQMQDQYGQWQQPQQGQDGQSGQEGQALADRQRQLREDLGRQRGLLPGRGTEAGDTARRNLDEAGRAMEEAEQALREGDPSGAMERQAQAIQNMREGMRALGQMQAQNQPGQEGQPQQGGQPGGPEGAEGQQDGQRGLDQAWRDGGRTDPLGRSTTGGGNQITSGDPLAEGADPARRARDLQDEIRRRSGERERPRDERDYLGRLLDNFQSR